MKRIIKLESALIAVDKWLNSDDCHIVDRNGTVIVGARLEYKPLSMTKRFTDEMEEVKILTFWVGCKCKGGPKGRTLTPDFSHQICEECGKVAK